MLEQGAFLSITDSEFDIDNVLFMDGTAKLGGAMAFGHKNPPKENSFAIQNSNFINNKANEGGALYLISDITKIDKTTFKNNQAGTDRISGKGGAVLYMCENDCKLEITGS